MTTNKQLTAAAGCLLRLELCWVKLKLRNWRKARDNSSVYQSCISKYVVYFILKVTVKFGKTPI